MPLPPGPREPGVVSTARFARRPLDQLLRWQELYGNVFRIRFVGFPDGIYVAEPDAVRELFSGDQSGLRAGEPNGILAPIVGDRSVLVLDGREHLRQRKLLLPPFQGSRVDAARAVMRAAAEREVARWQPGSTVVLRHRMRALTFDVISHAVFGVTDPVRVERLRQALLSLIETSPVYAMSPWLRRDLGRLSPGHVFVRRRRVADALLLREIAERRLQPDLDERTDVLSLLLRARDEDGRPLSDGELRDELVTMLSAGHETTATALAFALELLMRAPDAMARTLDSLDDPAWLDCVGKETLRLRPVIDAAQRKLVEPRRVAGWDLPAGVVVYPAIALIHHREDLYPDARAFRPERFLEGAESYSWLPFGGGIRRCIGAAFAQAEIAEALRVILSQVELEPVHDEPDPVVLRGITVVPKHGVPARVVRRRTGSAAPAALTAGFAPAAPGAG